jgi:uncharacterized protein
VTLSLPSIPQPLEWHIAPHSWQSLEGGVSIEAPELTDFFVDPLEVSTRLNAPSLLFPVTEDFMLSARVQTNAPGTYDAGVLIVYQHDSSWGKLCFERSPQGEMMIVSVVTKGVSDDANAVVIPTDQVLLRISRLRSAWAFHYSVDGNVWHMVRLFSLEAGSCRAGFLAQSPTGAGCAVQFTEIQYKAEKLSDVRSGV